MGCKTSKHLIILAAGEHDEHEDNKMRNRDLIIIFIIYMIARHLSWMLSVRREPRYTVNVKTESYAP